jgi:hypothetical protein
MAYITILMLLLRCYPATPKASMMGEEVTKPDIEGQSGSGTGGPPRHW